MNTIELEKKVKQIAHSLVYEKGFICSVDVLLKLDYLAREDYESWRFGKIEYLEKVCKTNLSTLSLVNKTIRKTANDLKLEPSWTGYHKFGKGERTKLIFSKSGVTKIEEGYATHYIDKNRINEIKGNKASV